MIGSYLLEIWLEFNTKCPDFHRIESANYQTNIAIIVQSVSEISDIF